jgi:hypothetical protein
MHTEYYLACIGIVQLKTQKKSIFGIFFKKNAKKSEKCLQVFARPCIFVTRNSKKALFHP